MCCLHGSPGSAVLVPSGVAHASGGSLVVLLWEDVRPKAVPAIVGDSRPSVLSPARKKYDVDDPPSQIMLHLLQTCCCSEGHSTRFEESVRDVSESDTTFAQRSQTWRKPPASS